MEKLKGRTILIVDDEPDLRDILCEVFSESGANVLSANCGKDAFELIQTIVIDAVISDVRMPNGNGVELLKNTKQFNPNKPIFFLLTGNLDHSNQEVLSLGAHAILTKPCKMNDLIELVRVALLEQKQEYVRKFERISANFKLQMKFENCSSIIVTKVFNLGRGGFFAALESDFPPVLGMVDFELELAESTVSGVAKGKGVCRWVRKSIQQGIQSGIGVEFNSLEKQSSELIERWVKAQPSLSD
jgi:CheY-like chemotaxis protein